MKSYQLHFSQQLPIPLSEAWDFFSSPMNLTQITPEDMAFEITSAPQLKTMYPGMIITYKVSPIPGIRFNWVTEITQVVPQEYFIDEQRFGPYQFWHHQHHFKAVEAGVEMTDILTYGLPMGIFGRIANAIFVADKIRKIFNYRKEKVNSLFGTYPSTGT